MDSGIVVKEKEGYLREGNIEKLIEQTIVIWKQSFRYEEDR